MKPTANRKGQLELYVLAGVGIAIFLAVIAFGVMYFGGSEGLSIAESCSDFETIPGPVACTTDQDCVTTVSEGLPPDPTIALRCDAGVCQASFCGGSS